MAKNKSSFTRPLVALVVTEGVLAILFGIAAIFWPGATASLFAVLFGTFILIWGIAVLVQSLMGIGRLSLWWLELIFGVLILGTGIYLIRNPDVAIDWLILLTGFTFVLRGLVDLVLAFFSRNVEIQDNRWFYVIGGLLGLMAGVVVLTYPAASGVAFMWVVGLYAILEGVLLITLANKFQELVDGK